MLLIRSSTKDLRVRIEVALSADNLSYRRTRSQSDGDLRRKLKRLSVANVAARVSQEKLSG